MKDIFGEIKPKSEHSSGTLTVIMGHPGVGKTVLATNASELGFTILINFENRISHIDEHEDLRFIPRSSGEFREDKICTYEQFVALIDVIKNSDQKPKYVIIDTIDSMFDVFLQRAKANFTDQRMAYGNVYQDLRNLLSNLKNTGVDIISTSHVLNDTILNKINISLNEKLRNNINKITDNIFYLEVLEDGTRKLILKSNETVQCKLTTKSIDKYNKAPNEIINPSWVEIEEVLK